MDPSSHQLLPSLWKSRYFSLFHALFNSANEPKNLSHVDNVSEFTGLDGLICGIPTWNTGADRERSGTAWDGVLEDIGELDLGVRPWPSLA